MGSEVEQQPATLGGSRLLTPPLLRFGSPTLPTEFVPHQVAEPALVDWRAAETAPAAVRLLDVPLADARHRAAVAVLSDDDVTLTRLGDVLR